MTISDSIKGYWKLDESSGNPHDSSGNNNNLTNNGTTPFVSAKLNNGADFESGSSQYFSILTGAQTGLNITSDFSISCWVKLESAPSDSSMVIMSRRTSDTLGFEFYYNDTAGTKKIWLDVNNGGAVTYTWTQTLDTATWYHLVVTWLAGTGAAICYLNGSSLGTVTSAATIAGGSVTLGIGSVNSGGSYFDGVIDEIGIWSRVLPGSDVTILYGAGTPPAFTIKLEPTVGTYTLTGISAVFAIAKILTAAVGSFILTGIAALFRYPGTNWTNPSKSSTTWTNLTKH